MPIYLCKPGPYWNTEKPSQHGVPVYAHPFCLEDVQNEKDRREQNQHTTRNARPNATVSRRDEDPPGRVIPGGAAMNPARDNDTPPRGANDIRRENNDAGGMEGHNIVGHPAHVQQVAQDQQRDRTGEIDATYDQIRINRGRNEPINQQELQQQRELWERQRITGIRVLRTIRHIEVVLVDAVFFLYQTYWLRLRWPGPKGGAAGYIALPGSVPSDDPNFDRCMLTTENEVGEEGADEVVGGVGEGVENENMMEDMGAHTLVRIPPEDDDQDAEDDDCLLLEPQITEGSTAGRYSKIDNTNDTNSRDNVSQTVVSVYPPRPRCESSGLYYPTSPQVELLAGYDDGLAALMAASDVDSLGGESLGLEKVICRICREGLHDIDYEPSLQDGDQTGGATNDGGNGGGDGNLENHHPAPNELAAIRFDPGNAPNQVAPPRQREPQANARSLTNTTVTTPHPYAQNPLLSPCECSGSMAFVHYLCIEQWRCRSRHPAARSGSHCETCRAPYALPPRPISTIDPNRDLRAGGVGGDPDDPNNDLLEGMPPHVLHALRNPHLGWRIGSSLVRRRWLRPFAPILISPAVALYCRARRALKKRGVSRRRWACSLCRRRARWKCVRCLRSYYCSRQCQNVSWHIVHKHVCYKPARFGWSVVVYGGLLLWFVPGISEYPLIYDLGLSFLWLSFGCMGILGGGIATALKRGLGLDIRGRTLEGVVVVLTIAFAGMLWHLIWGFFLGDEQCWGVAEQMGFGRSSPVYLDSSPSTSTSLSWHLPYWGSKERPHPEENNLGFILTMVQNVILRPGKFLVELLDKKILLKLDPRIKGWLCSDDQSDLFCLQIARDANPDFILPSHQGKSPCGSDMYLAACIFLLAGFFLAFGYVWRRREWVWGRGRDLRMRGGGRRRRLGRRDIAAMARLVEEEAGERVEGVRLQRHPHQD